MEDFLSSFINACYHRSFYYDKKDWLTRNGFLDKYIYDPKDFEYVRYFFTYNDPLVIKRIKPGKRHIHHEPHYAYSWLYRTPILARENDIVEING